jgi:hypothetical protein
MLRRLFLTMASIALAVVALAGVTGTAGADTQEAAPRPVSAQDIWYLFQNYNNLCMDIGSNAPGTVVGMTGCNYNLTSQRWYPYALGGDYITIENYNYLCMDLGSNDVGTPVVIAYCRPGYTSQIWKRHPDGTIRNYNGLCMDLGSNAPGAPVVMAVCRPGFTSQMWYFI